MSKAEIEKKLGDVASGEAQCLLIFFFGDPWNRNAPSEAPHFDSKCAICTKLHYKRFLKGNKGNIKPGIGTEGKKEMKDRGSKGSSESK